MAQPATRIRCRVALLTELSWLSLISSEKEYPRLTWYVKNCLRIRVSWSLCVRSVNVICWDAERQLSVSYADWRGFPNCAVNSAWDLSMRIICCLFVVASGVKCWRMVKCICCSQNEINKKNSCQQTRVSYGGSQMVTTSWRFVLTSFTLHEFAAPYKAKVVCFWHWSVGWKRWLSLRNGSSTVIPSGYINRQKRNVWCHNPLFSMSYDFTVKR